MWIYADECKSKSTRVATVASIGEEIDGPGEEMSKKELAQRKL